MRKDIKISKLEYAYDKNKMLVNIITSVKGENYYLDRDLTIPLLVAEGNVNVKHFRRHSSIDQDTIINYFGSSESIEHLNAKRQILIDNGIYINGTFIQASKVVLEVRFPETGNIIDAVLYDYEDKILLGVEICHTNKKSQEDIDKLNKLNINIYEKNTNHRGNRFICVRGERSEYEGNIRKGKEYISRIRENIEKKEGEIMVLKQRLEERRLGNGGIRKAITEVERYNKWAGVNLTS